MTNHSSAITLTFGDVCENHVGMEKIGNLCNKGISYKTLQNIHSKFKKHSELINLNKPGIDVDTHILVIRNGVNILLADKIEDLYSEQKKLKPDMKAYMRGRVVNKIARYNLCFSKKGHSSDYINKKGTIVAFDEVPVLFSLKKQIENLIDHQDLECEGNYYYDISSKKVGIGRHGDTERRIVVGVRLGESFPIEFYWYKNLKPIDNSSTKIILNHGDIYLMEEKTTGFDWKVQKYFTLRHAAGSDAFLQEENKRIEKLLKSREKL